MKVEAESSAARVALWRALHVQCDDAPPVFEDLIGLALLAPEAGWQDRPDMHLVGTAPFRASIVGRSRFIEDLVEESFSRPQSLAQYVILGAGIDTFAQRRADLASRMTIFEVDRTAPQIWKRQRLEEAGYKCADWLKFVGVDFESGESWWQKISEQGFDRTRSAIVSSMGVSMYLSREAIVETLKQAAMMAPGSKFVMSFLLPVEMADPAIRPGVERSLEGARRSGTPFLSFFMPSDLQKLAGECGFAKVEHVSAATLADRYFAGRSDSLRPPNNCEELIIATV